MIEAGWSSRRVARQLGHSDCVVKRCWDQWIQEMKFTRSSDSGRPRKTSRREDLHTIEKCTRTANCFVSRHPGTGNTFIPSSRTIRRRLAEGYLRSRCFTCVALDAHPSMPPFGVVPRTRKLDCSGMEPGRLKRRIYIQSQP
ncbi:uncharacterized protein TNCV_4999581 [Trichonephila clavipes]|nr:uncharacterized protein TNCV_4999581 [Trichonephila clavipes]